jgi:hypothetical protein
VGARAKGGGHASETQLVVAWVHSSVFPIRSAQVLAQAEPALVLARDRVLVVAGLVVARD